MVTAGERAPVRVEGRPYTLYQVDAFTRERFAGNPAGVVLDASGLSGATMQRIARELANPQTAFLLPPREADHDVFVRYFTPTTEVPLCGHATIAAHHVRAQALGLGSGVVWQRSAAGRLPVRLLRDGDALRVRMTQAPPAFEAVLDIDAERALLAALRLRPDDLDLRCPLQVVSTGHAKVLVGLRDRDRLHAVRPDLHALAELSAVLDCNGYFLFTLDAREEGVLTACRMFAPAIGIPEDPVTGNGNGPLGAYLVHHRLVAHDGSALVFRSTQGETMGRKGSVRVEVRIAGGEPVEVQVGDDAVIAFVATLYV